MKTWHRNVARGLGMLVLLFVYGLIREALDPTSTVPLWVIFLGLIYSAATFIGLAFYILNGVKRSNRQNR